MTVKELIERLETFEPEMDVELEFWRDHGETNEDSIGSVFGKEYRAYKTQEIVKYAVISVKVGESK